MKCDNLIEEIVRLEGLLQDAYKYIIKFESNLVEGRLFDFNQSLPKTNLEIKKGRIRSNCFFCRCEIEYAMDDFNLCFSVCLVYGYLQS